MNLVHALIIVLVSFGIILLIILILFLKQSYRRSQDNDQPDLHVRNLKPLPAVESEVDKCIECGYCEPVCPSADLTMTPRRRIVARRAIAAATTTGNLSLRKKLLSQYQYDGLDTCAVDGLCAGACPVYINTGDLVKRLRNENHSPLANTIALQVSRHFKAVEAAARFALTAGSGLNKLLGRRAMPNLT
ncbi:MAG: (Fe-S)-binding protein, partial [Sphingobacteriales bacterium]